uniref:Uncharacterized protein n=1 Tax=Arundo donax TaxID=35708 RepID=A0A0A9B1K9_ARUDO
MRASSPGPAAEQTSASWMKPASKGKGWPAILGRRKWSISSWSRGRNRKLALVPRPAAAAIST